MKMHFHKAVNRLFPEPMKREEFKDKWISQESYTVNICGSYQIRCIAVDLTPNQHMKKLK